MMLVGFDDPVLRVGLLHTERAWLGTLRGRVGTDRLAA
ncbi:hypothetical protein FB558_4036 [Pseudonocardia kunmingensis]|uniref:Uncharacterized protein n=1 Tax=Pseudonocardia kunmingensis TaxID=630975 RepID=A0A543DQ84_9PSEU|nr:hypothetical protein FB558_4036 [Pseudonocardia kunmingensis]